MTSKDPWRTGTGARAQAQQRPQTSAKFVCSIVSIVCLYSHLQKAFPVFRFFIYSGLHSAPNLLPLRT